MNKWPLIAMPLLVASLFSFVPAHAQECTLSVRAQDLSIVPSEPFFNQSARVYATVQPDCQRDTEGTVLFYANDKPIGTKPISYKKAGRAEEVWTNWIPSDYGDNVIRVDTKGESGEVGDSATITIFIDHDTDVDGIGNVADPDDDNDGVPDAQDSHPLDPARSRDTDKDGQDDSTDSDDDNDGLYDFEEKDVGTNPLKYDTDSDAVGDKQDAYPLDPKRSEAPVETKDEPLAEAPTSDPTQPTPGGEVLGTEFTTINATASLNGIEPEAQPTEERTTVTEWMKATGRWLALAAAFLALGTFFLWKSHGGIKKNPPVAGRDHERKSDRI